ncbi:MAG: acylphosphatase [Dehalococcoidales bacterium]
MADLTSVQATVYGRVQGVFFRAFVAEHAHGLGLTGYVRNLPVGALEVVAEGDRKQLAKLIDYLKIGPPDARVEKVVTNWSEYSGNYSGFRIRY